MQSEVLKGHLEMLLLAAVAPEPAHGYRLVERLRERSHGEFDLAEGTVYPALHRLEGAGLLSSLWSRDAPRRRRVYQLTDRGRAALADEREDWRGFVRAVEAVLS
jgi:DNA-binding PadR family transcriptional regulator